MKKLLSLLILLAPGLMVADEYLNLDNMPKTGEALVKELANLQGETAVKAKEEAMSPTDLIAASGGLKTFKDALKGDKKAIEKLKKHMKKYLGDNLNTAIQWGEVICDEDFNRIIMDLMDKVQNILKSFKITLDVKDSPLLKLDGPVCRVVKEVVDTKEAIEEIKEQIALLRASK